MHKDWLNRNRCPYCRKWHPVSNMLHYHLEHNQCGLVPEDWEAEPPSEEPWNPSMSQ